MLRREGENPTSTPGHAVIKTHYDAADADKPHYARARELAAIIGDGRVMAWIGALKRPEETERIRQELLFGIRGESRKDLKVHLSDEARRSLVEFCVRPTARLVRFLSHAS